MRGRQSQQQRWLSGSKNGSFNERVLQRVDTKPKGFEATWIVSGDRQRFRISLCYQCEQQRTCQWPANKVIVASHFMFTNVIDDRAKPKLIKPEDAQYRAFSCGKNTYVKTYGLKVGRAFARRGHIFGKLRYM